MCDGFCYYPTSHCLIYWDERDPTYSSVWQSVKPLLNAFTYKITDIPITFETFHVDCYPIVCVCVCASECMRTCVHDVKVLNI